MSATRSPAGSDGRGLTGQPALDAVMGFVEQHGLKRVRIGWCDTHGVLRGKTLMPQALPAAFADGVGMVGTMVLKDTADRTAWPVFDAALSAELPGFAGAGNLLLRPDATTLRVLPWAPDTGWLQAQAVFPDGTPVPFDTRHVLQRALARLADAGYALRCGLEVEFHVYRIVDDRLDPADAAWPHEPPAVRMLHPGYHLLSEEWGDQADEVLRRVQDTAQGLGLPLRSLEIELGPSQFEAVFGVMDALEAADAMVLFRNGVRMALRRAGFHATFMCRPPFPNVMASGWHLHHSLVALADGRPAFVRGAELREPTLGLKGSVPASLHPDDRQGDRPAAEHRPPRPAAASGALDASSILAPPGVHWLAGLLAHAPAMAALCAPTVNAYGRFRPNALAPASVQWGRDNRGAMLRVVGGPGDAATRIENRLGEPSANPYLVLAAHIHAGLDGIEREWQPPPATESPYDGQGAALPTHLDAALDALEANAAMAQGFGADVVRWYARLKRSETARHAAAEDKAQWERREYFGRL